MSASCPLLGFRAAFEASRDGSRRDSIEEQWGRFLAERGLSATGGPVGERFEYLVTSEAGQATELDREAAERWLGESEEVRAHDVGALYDLRPDS
jgi:uncharacterized protein YggL (DUF469 family)